MGRLIHPGGIGMRALGRTVAAQALLLRSTLGGAPRRSGGRATREGTSLHRLGNSSRHGVSLGGPLGSGRSPPIRPVALARGCSAAAGAAATASASTAGGRCRRGCAAAGDRDGGQELHRVGVASGARRGGGRFGHRTAQLEGVAAGAAAVVIARHAHRVWLGGDSSSGWLPGLWKPHRARSMDSAGRCRPVVSCRWRTGRRHLRSGAGSDPRRRTSTGLSGAPARRPRRTLRWPERERAMTPSLPRPKGLPQPPRPRPQQRPR